MTPTEKIDYILEMITAVDPADMMRMAKIDGYIYCLMNGFEFLRVNIFNGKEETLRTEFYDPKDRREALVKFNNNIQYTRSRDLIKSLRPPGWWPSVMKRIVDDGGFFCELHAVDFSFKAENCWCGKGATEELAELYATMATIKYTIQQAQAALSRPGVEL